MSTLKVLGKKILLQKKEKEVKKGALIIAYEERETQRECNVLSVGDMVHGCSVGDVVIVAAYIGDVVIVNDITYIVVEEENIIAIIKE